MLKACNFIKERLQHGCFPVNISKVLGTTFFYRTTPVAAFEFCFSIRKEFLKKKVSGEIAFDLISLFHVQIQGSTGRSTTMREFVFLENLLNFIITKYLKQEIDDDLSICVDELSPCGLSITGDLKIYQGHVIKKY